MMFGPEGSGKTTLFCKLKLPLWDEHDLKKDMKAMRAPARDTGVMARPTDPGYHYDEIQETRRLGKYGLWDVPGNDAFTRLWPMFYRYINVSAVLFVVDASKEGIADDDKVASARRNLRFLLNEDELRVSAFFLILNVHQADKSKAHVPHAGEAAVSDDFDPYENVNTLKEMLQITKIESEPWNAIRFKSFAIDCAEVLKTDTNWVAIIDDIFRVFVAIGRGAQ